MGRTISPGFRKPTMATDYPRSPPFQMTNPKSSPPHSLFHTTFVCLLLLFVYAMAFYASANTPLAEASPADMLKIAGLCAMLAAVGSVLVALLGASLERLVRIRRPGFNLAKPFTCLLLVALFLLVLENMSYSFFGQSLKTGESVIIKIAFLMGSAFLAYQTCGGVLFLGRQLQRLGWAAVLLLALAPQTILWATSQERGSGSVVSAQPSRQGNAVNVLLISADGIDADAMSLYGAPEQSTPFLSGIADELMVFENAYTNSGNTTGAITAVLTGRSPLTTQIVYPPDILANRHRLNTLPALIRSPAYLSTQWSVPHFANALDQGLLYAFDYVHGSNLETYNTVTDALALSYAQTWFMNSIIHDQLGVIKDVLGLSELDNPYQQVAEARHPGSHSLSDSERMEGLQGDMALARETGRRLFSQVHFMGSHGARFHPGMRKFSRGMEQTEGWMRPFYLDAILEFDTRLADIYRDLEANGELEHTLLVIYSDHGRRWSPTARIPLVIRLPGGSGAGRYRANVQLLDIAPTVLDFLGITIPPWMDGSSLLRGRELPPNRLLVSASVIKSKKGDEGWIRDSAGREGFDNTNRFSAIYCNTVVSGVTAQAPGTIGELPGNSSGAACKQLDSEGLLRMAQEKVIELRAAY